MIRYFFLFFIFCSYNVFADLTYPFSANVFDYNEGGKLYVTDANSENSLFYFVKTSWISENETVYFWHGFDRKNAKAQSINNAYIVDAITCNSSLLLLVKEKNQIKISLFDSTGNIKISQVIDTNLLPINSENTYWIAKNSNFNNSKHLDNYYFLLAGNLFELKLQNDNFEVNLIANNIICAKYFRTHNLLVFIEDKKETGIVNFVDAAGNRQFIVRINLTDKTEIKQLQNYLVILNSSKNQDVTLLQFIDINSKNIISSTWLQANNNCIDFSVFSNNIYMLATEKNISNITKIPISEINKPENWQQKKLPINLYSTKKLKATDSKIYVFSENCFMILDTNINVTAFDYIELANYISDEIDLTELNNKIILAAARASITLEINKNQFWFINEQIENTGKYAVYIILIMVFFIIYRIYRNQKRLLDAILDLPSAGFIFLVNQAGKLVRTNENGRKILGISPQILLKKQFSYYCNNEQNKQLAELIEQCLANRISFQQKINIQYDNSVKEWFCSLLPLRNITGRFRGIVLTGIDITEELEKKTLTNWAQLAHDMQTNLSTIRLNAEQIEADNENNEQRKKKIVYQVSVLMQRIRDIVTVGRDDKLDRITVNSTTFCQEVLQEFDSNLFKNVNYELKIDDFDFICDKPKLIRCVRNAIENGIKSMKGNLGTIILSCRKDIHNVYISIRDTGEGMDENTKKKISKPFFSTARSEGGSGIGTMIMQRVAELHGGKITIESTKNEGTEITIQFPDILRRK